MAEHTTPRRERWSGRFGFICANIASAVGLGSIWKFPYEVGSNGGSAFVFCYLIGAAFIVFPLMLAEFALGRRGRSDAIGSIQKLASAADASRGWAVFGAIGVAAGFLILSFYSVIGGWAIAYLVETLWSGLPAANVEATQARFDDLLASPLKLVLNHSIFMAAACAIVARGIAAGIEEVSKFLMPLLAVLVAGLAIFAAFVGDFAKAVHFMVAFDPAQIGPHVAIEALGLGFFSIGVGFCIMLTYAAYSGARINLREVAIVTVVSDTVISFLAGFAIFPLVFAEHLDPSSGPGLIFTTLPVAFARMPLGTLAAAAFFALLIVAALGSAISFVELSVAPLRNALRWSRPRASLLCGLACWALGLPSLLSFNLWSSWYPLSMFGSLAKATFYDLIDHLTSNMMLPLAGFGLAIFVGWVLPAPILRDELKLSPRKLTVLRWLLRYVVPLGIAGAALAPLL